MTNSVKNSIGRWHGPRKVLVYGIVEHDENSRPCPCCATQQRPTLHTPASPWTK